MLILLHFSPDYFSFNGNAKVLLLMFKFSTVTVNKTVLRQGLHEQIIFFVSLSKVVKKKTYAILVELVSFANFGLRPLALN